MAKSEIHLTRREFIKGLFFLFIGADSLNRLLATETSLQTKGEGALQYEPKVISKWDNLADQWTNKFSQYASMFDVQGPKSISQSVVNERSNSIIKRITPNSIFVVMPGALTEEIADWLPQVYTPWIAAFHSRQSGESLDDSATWTAHYLDSLKINDLKMAPMEIRIRENFKAMMSGHVVFNSWENVSGGRKSDGSIPIEPPEMMAAYVAGYMKWALKTNPDANFIVLGHSLGASSLHCLLRLIQGGAFSDIAPHLNHAILYSQAVNDLTNKVAYSIAHSQGEVLKERIQQISNLAVNKDAINIADSLSVLQSLGCTPQFFEKLNPDILRKKYQIGITSALNLPDPTANTVPGANELVVDLRNRLTSPIVKTGIAKFPDRLISVPDNFWKIFEIMHDPIHYPNPAAIKPLFLD